MADDNDDLPPHVKAQATQAAAAAQGKTGTPGDVPSDQQNPTEWQRKGNNQLPEPERVEPIKPREPEPEQPREPEPEKPTR